MATTAIHREVEACRAGTCERLVTRLASGFVVLGQIQVRLGYCLLLPDPVVEDLNALRGTARERFLADTAAVGDALLALTGAKRINYAIFGNVEPALHAHVIPRYAGEPEAERMLQPWALDWDNAPRFEGATHGPLKARIAAALGSGCR